MTGNGGKIARDIVGTGGRRCGRLRSEPSRGVRELAERVLDGCADNGPLQGIVGTVLSKRGDWWSPRSAVCIKLLITVQSGPVMSYARCRLYSFP